MSSSDPILWTNCDLISGACTTFKEAMEVYMATAGTHYKRFSQIYYDVSAMSQRDMAICFQS